MSATAVETSRYDNSWDFTGRSDAYLREAFDLLATSPEDAIYRGGMRAIIDETHGRALKVNAARTVLRVARPLAQAHRSDATRKVCTKGVVRRSDFVECGAPAVVTWDATFGGMVLIEQGACSDHA